ncbi:MAG: signal transduction histidine kinase, partial [Kiritimatiellia bacterium]
MKRSLPLRSFLWLSVLLLLFFFLDTAFLIWIEAKEFVTGKPVTWEEVSEWVLLVPLNIGVLVLMIIMIRFVNRHMIAPLQSMARTATNIKAGHLDERMEVASTNYEVDIVANTLNDAFDRYQEIVDRLQQFSSNTSHQLRTPLAAIRNAGEVCLQKDRSSETYREVIKDMLEEVHTLTRVIEQLLLLSRLDSKEARRNFKAQSLNGVLRQVADMYQSLCDKEGIQLLVKEDAHVDVRGDDVLLHQVFANLVDNSMRYTPRGGTITLGVALPQQGTVKCYVSDTGTGIPES